MTKPKKMTAEDLKISCLNNIRLSYMEMFVKNMANEANRMTLTAMSLEHPNCQVPVASSGGAPMAVNVEKALRDVESGIKDQQLSMKHTIAIIKEIEKGNYDDWMV